MIVFEYLYDMMDVFGPLMDKYAKGDLRHIDNEDKDKVCKTNMAFLTMSWCHLHSSK